MPVWFAYVGFPIGTLLIARAFWKPTEGDNWHNPERPKAFVWGVAIIAVALDAAIFGYLPTWGE